MTRGQVKVHLTVEEPFKTCRNEVRFYVRVHDDDGVTTGMLVSCNSVQLVY